MAYPLGTRCVDQDLDFDEGLEDDELDQHKPPNRRPLLWIVILLLAVGIVYWALKPDFFMTTGTDSMDQPPSPGMASPVPGQTQPNRATSPSLSSPKFAEGQQVLFSKDAKGNTEPSSSSKVMLLERNPGQLSNQENCSPLWMEKFSGPAGSIKSKNLPVQQGGF